MKFILNNFWIVFIIVTILNGFSMRQRFMKNIHDYPELEKGYNDFWKGFLIIGNIPWIIMGIGSLAGLTNNIFEYFYPRLMNPIVLIFHVALIGIYLLGIWWIYIGNGAEFIEKHPEVLRNSRTVGYKKITATQIKLFFPLCLLGGIIGMIMMWTSTDTPPIVSF